MHATVYGTKCGVVCGAIVRWLGLRRNTARFRAVSHSKRPYTAKLRLKIRLSVIIDQGNWLVISIESNYIKSTIRKCLFTSERFFERERKIDWFLERWKKEVSFADLKLLVRCFYLPYQHENHAQKSLKWFLLSSISLEWMDNFIW
jgi:hypothetical protein